MGLRLLSFLPKKDDCFLILPEFGCILKFGAASLYFFYLQYVIESLSFFFSVSIAAMGTLFEDVVLFVCVLKNVN